MRVLFNNTIKNDIAESSDLNNSLPNRATTMAIIVLGGPILALVALAVTGHRLKII